MLTRVFLMQFYMIQKSVPTPHSSNNEAQIYNQLNHSNNKNQFTSFCIFSEPQNPPHLQVQIQPLRHQTLLTHPLAS